MCMPVPALPRGCCVRRLLWQPIARPGRGGALGAEHGSLLIATVHHGIVPSESVFTAAAIRDVGLIPTLSLSLSLF